MVQSKSKKLAVVMVMLCSLILAGVSTSYAVTTEVIENYSGMTVGTRPTDWMGFNAWNGANVWTIESYTGGSVTVENDAIQGNCVKYVKTGEGLYIQKQLTPISSGIVEVSMKLKVETSDKLILSICDPNKNVIASIKIMGDTFAYWGWYGRQEMGFVDLQNNWLAGPFDGVVPNSEYWLNNWIDVKFVLDLSAGTWDFYVNGTKYSAGKALTGNGTVASINTWTQEPWFNNGTLYFDDIGIKSTVADEVAPYEVSDFSFYKQDGVTKTTSFSESVSAKASFKNNEIGSKTVTLVAVVYKDGCIDGINTLSYPIDGNSITPMDITLPTATPGGTLYHAKVFMWDSLSGLKPFVRNLETQ